MKRLGILLPDDQINMSTVACIVGSYQVFSAANSYFERLGRETVFRVNLVSVDRKTCLEQGFLTMKADSTIQEDQKYDLIIVPATMIRTYDSATVNNKALMDWMKNQYERGVEIASMCAGSFMLASAGLLTGRICSTHWALEEDFRSLFPEVNIQTDKLITDENRIYTNGGAYSFLHLLMYLVQKFYDRETAIHCAKYFQIDLNRTQQSQFLIFSGHKRHTDQAILEAQSLMESNFSEITSMEKLSKEVGLSRRNFDRRFIKATGLRPFDYIQRIKIEAAKKSFENTRKSVSEVMFDVGYSDAKAFREVFTRVTGITPAEYKAKYNTNLI